MDAEVFAFLLDQVEEAKRVYDDARRRFWEIADKPREWPAAGSSPDGSERFRKVIAHEKFAMRAYIEAMTRLNRYLRDGTLPAESPVKPAPRTAAAGS